MSGHVNRVSSRGRFLAVAGLLGAGYLIGLTTREATVQADVRGGGPVQEPFQTGDQRCEVVLREISAKLNTMDARIERMEKLATQFVNREGQQLPGEIRQR